MGKPCLFKAADTAKWIGVQAWEGTKAAGNWLHQNLVMRPNNWVGNQWNDVLVFFGRGDPHKRAIEKLINNAHTLQRTNTVMNKVDERPYVMSTQLIQEIMRAASPIPDPRSETGLKWVVEGY